MLEHRATGVEKELGGGGGGGGTFVGIYPSQEETVKQPVSQAAHVI